MPKMRARIWFRGVRSMVGWMIMSVPKYFAEPVKIMWMAQPMIVIWNLKTKAPTRFLPRKKRHWRKYLRKRRKQKWIDKKSGEEHNLPEGKLYISFDFECTQNTGSHAPNLVHATRDLYKLHGWSNPSWRWMMCLLWSRGWIGDDFSREGYLRQFL